MGGQIDRRVGELHDAALGEELVIAVRVGGERARVAHHHLEEHDAVRSRDEGSERVALVERDVRARRAVPFAARHLAVDDEDDVIAVVAVGLHDHAGIPPGVERQVTVGELEPPLPHRRSVIAVLLTPALLPRAVVDLGEARTTNHANPVPSRTPRRRRRRTRAGRFAGRDHGIGGPCGAEAGAIAEGDAPRGAVDATHNTPCATCGEPFERRVPCMSRGRFLVGVLNNAGTGNDYARVQVSDPVTGEIIYDTQPGDPDNATPTTLVAGFNPIRIQP